MVTTVNEKSSIVQALKVGLQGYFFKPLNAALLAPKIKEIEARLNSSSTENADQVTKNQAAADDMVSQLTKDESAVTPDAPEPQPAADEKKATVDHGS